MLNHLYNTNNQEKEKDVIQDVNKYLTVANKRTTHFLEDYSGHPIRL